MARKRPRRSKHKAMQHKPAPVAEMPREEKPSPPQNLPESLHSSPPASKGMLMLKDDRSHARVSVSSYIAFAIAMGFISLLISPFIGNTFTIFVAVAVAWAAGKAVKGLLGAKETKWLISNGLFIYFFVWLISWILFFNLLG